MLVVGLPNITTRPKHLPSSLWGQQNDSYTRLMLFHVDGFGRDIQFINSAETSHLPISQYLIFRKLIAGIDSVAEESNVAKAEVSMGLSLSMP